MELEKCIKELVKDEDKVKMIIKKYNDKKYNCVISIIKTYREEILTKAREANRQIECLDYLINKINELV